MFGYEAAWVSGPASPPDAPTNLSASEKTCSGSPGDVDLSFTDNSTNEAEWVVYESGSLFDVVPSTQSDGTGSLTITSSGPLRAGSTASFTVAAKNSVGESAEAGPAAEAIRPVPNAPGVSLEWISSSDLGCGVDVGWNNVADECGYRVYRKRSTDTSFGDPITDQSADSTGYFDGNASENTSYDYKTESYNDHGSADSSDNITTSDCTGGITPEESVG